MQTALDNAVKLINGDQKVLQQTAALMLQQLKTNNVDEAEIIKGIVGENATTLHSSTNAIINELSGEGGVKKLLDGLGVKLGDIASLDIAGAINNRTPDASVSNIDTTLSIVKDSLGEDIGGKLREIELSIGTIKLSEEQKQNIKDEIARLEGIDNKTSSIQGKIDKLKEILEQSDKTLKTISGNTAKGDTNVAGDVKNPPPLKTAEDVSADESRVVNDPKPQAASGQTDDETKDQSDLKEKNATLAEDSVMAAIRTGKQRSAKITDAEKKLHVPLWEYIVKNFGYAPNSTTYKQLASALGVSVKNKKKITKEEKNKILKKLKSYIKKHFSGSNASAAAEFKSGIKKIDEDLLAWTNENWDKNGSEMIIRAKDNAILTPLKAKDAVIPANLADNLFKWGAISPDKFIINPFMGKWSADGGSTTNTDANYSSAAQTIEMHFDSLFHIEGNVDESVMPRLESLGKSLVNDKDFQKNVIKFVTKDFVRESKKQGIR